jgi:alkylated DNA nucleotide flippase Atl1
MPTLDESRRMPVSVRFSVGWKVASWISPPQGKVREYGTVARVAGSALPESSSMAAVIALKVDPGSYE